MVHAGVSKRKENVHLPFFFFFKQGVEFILMGILNQKEHTNLSNIFDKLY